jgi:hypothetical protein
MGLEDEGQRTELTREEGERRATVLLLCRLVSERHRQEQQRSEADARARRLRQEVDELYAYNMEISPHRRTSSSPISSKTAPPPPIGVLLE